MSTAREPIAACPACKGERVVLTPNGQRVCARCHGEGRVARGRAREPVTACVKECACGARYDEAAWSELKYMGPQDDGDGGWLELRNCADCGSTIARDVEAA